MSKHIEIVFTTDEYDCDQCGGDYAQARKIICGDKEYGENAVAHCFGGYSNELSDILIAFLEAEGYTISYSERHFGEQE